MHKPELSIIIPTLNEAVQLPDTLRSLREAWPAAQIVVADGGSGDSTVASAQEGGAQVIELKQGSRGIQLHAGAAVATADWLLFLHADTQLSVQAVTAANQFRTEGRGDFAMFRIRFDDPSLVLRISAWWTRFDSVFTRFGDQGILIKRSLYQTLGGFRPWPLFEDVDLIRRVRRQQRVDVLSAEVVTSARRFSRRGPLRQQLSNARLLLRFLAGGDPHQLAGRYPTVRESPSTP